MTATERRVARLSRHAARLVLELKREGLPTAAAKLEAAAIEAVALVRRGVL